MNASPSMPSEERMRLGLYLAGFLSGVLLTLGLLLLARILRVL